MVHMNFSALDAIGLEYPVVAVKFSIAEPIGLPRLGKQLAFCEMLKEAQEAGPFYATFAEHACVAGPYVLGKEECHPVFESGRAGPELGVYADAAANRHVYSELPRFPPASALNTLFARLDVADFDPDLMIITAPPSQAEIVLRAHGYTNGAAWEAKGTTVLGCAYLYAHPHLTGRMNVLVSGLHHGMRARGLFPEGLMFLSIPAPLIPMILDNLGLMAAEDHIHLPQYHWGKEAHEAHMHALVERLDRAEESGEE